MLVSTRDEMTVVTRDELVREGVAPASIRDAVAIPASIYGSTVIGAVELATHIGRIVALVVQRGEGQALVTRLVWYDRSTNRMRTHDAAQPLPPL